MEYTTKLCNSLLSVSCVFELNNIEWFMPIEDNCELVMIMVTTSQSLGQWPLFPASISACKPEQPNKEPLLSTQTHLDCVYMISSFEIAESSIRPDQVYRDTSLYTHDNVETVRFPPPDGVPR